MSKHSNVNQIPSYVYFDIAESRMHSRDKSIGTTWEITKALHAINPKLTDVKAVDTQGTCYKFALFTGTEALCFPQKNYSSEPSKENYLNFDF